MSKVTAEDLKLWRVEAHIREMAVGAFATLSAAVGMYREAQELPGAVPHPVMARLCLAVDAHTAALRGMVDVPPVPPAVEVDGTDLLRLEETLGRTGGKAAIGFSRQQLEAVAEAHGVADWDTVGHGALVEAVTALYVAPPPEVPAKKAFRLKKR